MTGGDRHEDEGGPASGFSGRASEARLQDLERDRRVLGRHGDRVVRLLHLRDAGGDPGPEVLPARQRDGAAPAVPVHLRRRLRRAPLRRHLLRPHRRPGRAEVRLHGDPDHHGRDHRRGRPPTELRDDRLRRASLADLVQDRPGPGPGRGVRRGGHLRGRARPRQQAGLLHELHPDHGHGRSLPGHPGGRHHPAVDEPRELPGLGLPDPVPPVPGPPGASRSTSG